MYIGAPCLIEAPTDFVTCYISCLWNSGLHCGISWHLYRSCLWLVQVSVCGFEAGDQLLSVIVAIVTGSISIGVGQIVTNGVNGSGG